MGLFGLGWGSDQAAAKARFAELTPLEAHPHVLVYALDGIAETLWRENAFCPTAIGGAPAREEATLFLNYLDAGLVAAFVRFGYSFEVIGQSPDTLSDMAMAAIARAELQQLVFEMSSRHGAPVLFTESPMRSGKWHPVGAAMFDAGESGLIHLSFGHDGGGLIGELRYQARIGDRSGF